MPGGKERLGTRILKARILGVKKKIRGYPRGGGLPYENDGGGHGTF